MLAILRRQRGPISSFVACIQHADHQLTNPISLRDFNLTPPIAASHNDKNTIIRQATTAACPSTASTTSSNAILLDGRAVSAAWQDELAAEVARIRAAAGRPPGIGIVLVGERPDSQLYVARKTEACERVGMYSDVRHLPSSVSQRDLRSTVQKLCSDPLIDGILVQLPLPRHIDEEDIIESFDPAKDVDGFHPLNVGRTLMRGRSARFVPCTALGCMELLQRSHIQVKDASVVIVGDSNIVGMPLAMLFRDAGAATVTVVHRSSYSGLFGITPEGYRDVCFFICLWPFFYILFSYIYKTTTDDTGSIKYICRLLSKEQSQKLVSLVRQGQDLQHHHHQVVVGNLMKCHTSVINATRRRRGNHQLPLPLHSNEST